MSLIKKLFIIVLGFAFTVVLIVASLLLIDIKNNADHKYTFNEEKTDVKSTDGSVKLPHDDSSKDRPSSVETKPSISPDCLPSKFGFTYDVVNKDNKPIKDFKRDYSISFSSPDTYSDVQGVTCFRGNNYRNSASFGTPVIQEEKLYKVWNIKIGSVDTWTGVGWNGQPSIVKWDAATRNIMNIFDAKKQKDDLKEVIYATLDGNIYFLDLDDGQATRPPIEVGYPHKGSVSVDPRGYPLLYAGQGIDEVAGKKVPIGYRIFSLINQKPLLFIDGFDPFALRAWGAFDSTGLVDSKTDTLIECGENGILYTARLNTNYDTAKGKISINPDITKYRYHTANNRKLGTENSTAIYKNFAYFADNSGLLQCVDLNTLSPVWVRDVTDDTDSTIAIEDNGDANVSLYTACEVDGQGQNGYSYIRKLDAMTGELLWEKSVKCRYDSFTNGGALASPVVGKHDIENLVIYNIAKTSDKNGGKLIAFDKKTGSEIWLVNLENYCWSSPVDVYTSDGKSYLIVCDSAGNMMLIEGKSGRILDKIQLGANVEGSPAVFDNMIVVGTRGQKIWGIKIK